MTDFKIILIVALIWSFAFIIFAILEKLGLIPNLSKYFSKVYRGYDLKTFSGIFTGFSWAFLDGLITGTLIVLIIKFINN
jgi:hypothetical protein